MVDEWTLQTQHYIQKVILYNLSFTIVRVMDVSALKILMILLFLRIRFQRKILIRASEGLRHTSSCRSLNYTSYCRLQLQAPGQSQTDWHQNPAPGRTRSPHQRGAVSEPTPSHLGAFSARIDHDEQKWAIILWSCVQDHTHLSQRIHQVYDT